MNAHTSIENSEDGVPCCDENGVHHRVVYMRQVLRELCTWWLSYLMQHLTFDENSSSTLHGVAIVTDMALFQPEMWSRRSSGCNTIPSSLCSDC